MIYPNSYWLIFDKKDKALALTRKETFKIRDDFAIALGWHILKANTPNEVHWHNGGTGGYTSSMAFKTSNNTGVAVLTNLSAMHARSGLADELCLELLDLLK